MSEIAYSIRRSAISFWNLAGSALASVGERETMVRLKKEQRALLAETLRDIANIAAGAMVFGQFLADAMFSSRVAFGGLTLWVVLVGCAILLASEGQRS